MQKLLFVLSLLGVSWLAMSAIHELGHVVGAWATGGTVCKVILHPLAISRTDVRPNPAPGIVIWLGPILGSVLPVIAWRLAAKARSVGMLLQFFAGFCLVTNGAYIGIGAFDAVGDCEIMMQTGSPMAMLVSFGTASVAAGLTVWHRMGNLKRFLTEPTSVPSEWTWRLFAMLLVIATLEFSLSPSS